MKWVVRKKKYKFGKKDWSQQVEQMQVPNGTGSGVRRSKRPLSACYYRRKCSMETSHKSVKGRIRSKGHGLVLSPIGGGLSLYLVRLQNFIKYSWQRNFVLFDKIPVSIKKLLQWPFHAFLNVSLFEKFIWKTCRPQNKTCKPGYSCEIKTP